MVWVGITGGIACGKSSVVEILRKNNYEVLEADKIVEELYSQKKTLIEKITKYFGKDILNSKGEIDRYSLAKIVESSKENLAILEELVHPEVKREVEKWRDEKKNLEFLFYEIPLLFEKKMESEFDIIICVSCSDELQLQRLMARNSFTRERAKKRIELLIPNKYKEEHSDFVIKNLGSFSQLEDSLLGLLKKLKQYYHNQV